MLPPKDDLCWLEIINSPEEIQFSSVPTRMLMMRIKMLAQEGTPQRFQEALNVMYDFFLKNENILKDDIHMIHKYCMKRKPSLLSPEETEELIKSGERLLIAGDEKLLMILPRGEWIGGTIPYFMTDEGGLSTDTKLQVLILPDLMQDIDIKMYSKDNIQNLPQDYKSNGASFIIIPAFTEIHKIYARDCSTWTGLFERPLVGWVSGGRVENVDLVPKIFNGQTLQVSNEHAIVMHTNLPEDKFAKAYIINLFNQGLDDVINFNTTGFEVEECVINSKETNFADYILEKNIDTQLPLVASYMGTNINVSIRSVDKEKKKVLLYAPIFENISYGFANKIGDYEEMFRNEIKHHKGKPVFSCNCVLNYLYANLESKRTDRFMGPMTFGEIGYMLLNQTLVYLTIESKGRV